MSSDPKKKNLYQRKIQTISEILAPSSFTYVFSKKSYVWKVGNLDFFVNIVQIAPNLIQGPPGHAKRLFPPCRPDMHVHIHRTHTKVVQIHTCEHCRLPKTKASCKLPPGKVRDRTADVMCANWGPRGVFWSYEGRYLVFVPMWELQCAQIQ